MALVGVLVSGVIVSEAAPCNAKPKLSWTDSVSVNGKCYCASSNFDHGIGTVKPAGYRGLTVRQICARLGTAPAGNHRHFNDIQCGNGPANTADDEQPECCPGRVDQGRSGCQRKGPKWDRDAILGTNNDSSNSNSSTEAPEAGSVVSLKGNNGQYVSSENGRKAINCNRDSAREWEIFTLVDAGGDKVALRGNNGRYLSSEDGDEAMTCTRKRIGTEEKFTIRVIGKNRIALKGNNGRYISSENGRKSMTCNRTAARGWETFTWQSE